MSETVINMASALETRIAEIETKLKDAVLAQADMKVINALTKELATARKTATSIARMTPEEEDDSEDARQAAEDMEIIKADIRLNILSKFDYYWVHDQEKFVLYDEHSNEWTYNTPRGMTAVNSKLVPNSDYYNLFMEVLKEDNRWFRSQTASFYPAPNKLNRLRYTKLELINEPHDPLFDIVVRSVAGDKPENINHIERVLIAKWHMPENFMLPVLCFSDGGATGKSLLTSTILTSLFGSASVAANAAMSDFAGQFNGHLCGKLVIMINENCEDSYNHNRMKMIAASPKVSFCNKGQMPFEADNTALLIVTGNSVAGSIRVDGGDVDRRFSLIRGGAKLSTYTAPYLSEKFGQPITVEEAETWMKLEGQKILSDPKEVAKWLNHLVNKHGLVEDVPALHGADYRAAVASQKPLTTQVFEAFFNSPTFTYIKKPLVYEFYRNEQQLQGNVRTLNKSKFYETLNQWLKVNHPHIIPSKANWGKGPKASTADVYADQTFVGGLARPSLTPNDSDWFEFGPFGDKKIWKVSV